MRWTKVPEWLLSELVATPRDKRDATPGNALLAYTVLGACFADWHTRIAEATQSDLADATGLSRSSAGRCVDLLERVRALDVLSGREGWKGRSKYLLAVETALPTGGHREATLPTGGRALPTGGHLHAVVSAGQDVARCPRVGSTTQNQESSPDAIEEDVWGLIEVPTLPLVERDPDVVRWLNDPDRLRHPIPAEASPVRAMRAASRAPEPSPRVHDLGRTCSEVARRLTEDARTAGGEGRG